MKAYVTGTGVCLPNAPVDNEQIEKVLGPIAGATSRTKRRILKNNGIATRHYAIDPATGAATHTNARMTAEAVRDLLGREGVPIAEIECLATGTSTPDQWIPSHGLMVHGELGAPPCEVVTTAGVCASGMTALKYAALNVGAGLVERAVATGSELASSLLRASHFGLEESRAPDDPERSPLVAFEQEFLRWMLSDGAGAMLVSRKPRAGGISLRIDWIEVISFAGSIEACMYWGARKEEDGSLTGWRNAGALDEARRSGVFNLTQDVKLLGREVSSRLVTDAFPGVRAKHSLAPGDVTWFLPHYSSEFFREELYDRFLKIDFPIAYERWFTNLATKGNTGSASIYIMLDELLRSGRVGQGDRLLCFVPESARFSAAYAHLTAVGPGDADA